MAYLYRYILLLFAFYNLGTLARRNKKEKKVVEPEVLEPYSFDFSANKPPLAYTTVDTAVELYNKVKLIAPVKDKYGAVSLNGYLESQSYEVDVEFTLRSEDAVSSGMGLFFLLRQPRDFPARRKGIHGISNENGFVLLLHQATPGKWGVYVRQRLRGAKLKDTSLLFTEEDSCSIALGQHKRAGFRIKVLSDKEQQLLIQVRDSEDVSYRDCVNVALEDGAFKPFITISSSNHHGNLNDFDLDAIYVRNTDPSVYQDKKELENIRLTLLANKYETLELKDGRVQAQDLLAAEIRDRVKNEQKKMLTFLDEGDDQFEMMFKYLETLKNFGKNLEDLEGKAGGYFQDQKSQEDQLMQNTQLDSLKTEISYIQSKSEMLLTNYYYLLELKEIASQGLLSNETASSQGSSNDPDQEKVKIPYSLSQTLQSIQTKMDYLSNQANEVVDELRNFNSEVDSKSKAQSTQYSSKTKSKRLSRSQVPPLNNLQAQILEQSTRDLKERVDMDAKVGYPLLNLIVLIMIMGVLASIWMRVSDQASKMY